MRSPASVERWSTWPPSRPLACPSTPRALSWATPALSRTWSLTWSPVGPAGGSTTGSRYTGSVPYWVAASPPAA